MINDFQDAPRPIVGLAHEYSSGFIAPACSNKRAQLLHVASGVMHVTTEVATFMMPPHRAAWIPAGALHEIRCSGRASAHTLYIDTAACNGLSNICRVFDVSQLLRALIREATSMPIEYDMNGRNGRVMALILDEIAAAAASPLHVPMPQHPRLLRLCQSILADPSQPLSLDDCARLSDMGRRTFTRLFRRETDTTFNTWRQQVRLMQAYARLVIGESVSRAAVDVGYCSSSAFATTFRKAFGVPPTRYLASASSDRR